MRIVYCEIHFIHDLEFELAKLTHSLKLKISRANLRDIEFIYMLHIRAKKCVKCI